MKFRLHRCVVAVAEELHFARAAERLHIEQSPLSRAIKELDEELGVRLFDRTTHSTRLTRARKPFLEHVPCCCPGSGVRQRDSCGGLLSGSTAYRIVRWLAPPHFIASRAQCK